MELLDDRVFAQDIVGQRGIILCHGRPVIPGESIVDGAVLCPSIDRKATVHQTVNIVINTLTVAGEQIRDILYG